MHDGSITIRIGADVREIERMSRYVRQFGELHEIPGRALSAVHLALDEVVSNVVLHGFDDPRGQQIVVRLEVEADQVRAWVEDAGREFDPESAPPADLEAPLATRPVGGLGIHLARSLMDDMEYRRTDSKNMLTLRKRIR